jgi:ribosomal protein S18 acetylase RimI-like enzyme
VITDDSWSCRMTNDLSDAFTEPVPGLPADNVHIPALSAIPGIVLSAAGNPAAAIGFHQEPDRTLSLSSPVFLNATLSDAVRAGMLGLMLKTANEKAAASQCTRIRYLQSTAETTHTPWVQPILQNAAFTLVARIVPWTSTVRLSSASASSFHSRALETADNQRSLDRYEVLHAQSLECATESFQILCCLLRSILSDSGDLAQMSPADAERLLKDWIAENTLVVLVHSGNVAVAICACVMQAEQVSANILDVQIRYLGVHPKFRRLKIAARLLKQLPSILQASGPLPREDARLTAFGDLANAAATGLYAGCGFVSGEAVAIWQRALENG